MKSKLLYSIFFSLSVFFTYAQSASDALNYSQTFNGGTARFVSMGGAFGALGGDFSTLSYNPAGLGIYRTSEFTLTPSFKKKTIGSTFYGENNEDSQTKLGFDNIGFVISYKPEETRENGLINFNIGFGYNRTNDFNSSSIARGDNPDNSMMDYFANKINTANRYYIDDLYDDENKYPFLNLNAPWDIVMAWNTMLLYDTVPGTGGTQYYPALLSGDRVTQKNVIETTGSSGEYLLSFATNFSNKFFIGATIGIDRFNYESTTTYSEDAPQSNGRWSNGDRFYYSDYIQNYEISGSGYNLKLGMIYKPIDGLRLGAAVHTPTYYDFDDTYSYIMKSNFDINYQENNFVSESPLGNFNYHFETPLKLIGSIAYIFKDRGLLSIDIEHLDYSNMSFSKSGDGSSFSDLNQEIKDVYKSVNNIKIGGEIRLKDVLLRGGYAFYPSPYKNGYLNKNANRSLISGGIGYRSGNFFIDAAYLYSIQKVKYYFYDLRNTDGSLAINPVSTKTTEGKFLVTMGFKF
jgi:hypothetical protein